MFANNTRKRRLFDVRDRFLPIVKPTSHNHNLKTYHNGSNQVIMDRVMLELPEEKAEDKAEERSEETKKDIKDQKPSTPHQKHISDALGVSYGETMLQFHYQQYSPQKGLDPSSAYGSTYGSGRDWVHSRGRKKPPPAELTATSLVHAPGLTNDFYFNLVSWSNTSNNIMVALNRFAYMWELTTHQVDPILYHEYHTISCVSCSGGNWAALGTVAGKVFLVDQNFKNKVVAHYEGQGNTIHSICWVDDNLMLASDHTGEVVLLGIHSRQLVVQYRFHHHRQLVCGIAINRDRSQVAFGSNDNTVSVWDVTKITAPKLQCVLSHTAAVKAMAFCPWTKSLLATGGGTRDRSIKFWHTHSGSLLHTFLAGAQVTCIMWSQYQRQLVATYGFGHTGPALVVYRYPGMEAVGRAMALAAVRILAATISPDGTQVCVATNDATIRIYRLWKETGRITGHRFGSDIIDLAEGVGGLDEGGVR